MKRVRQAHTAPELAVRALLTRLGVRYRTCVRSLPGSPDIVNRSAGWAIFVHGCFWHGHPRCRLFTTPKTNSTFWREKVDANRARDRRKVIALREVGLRVVVVWQCETRDPAKLSARLERELRARQ
jgi:DNA mismatch endonuclease (patch repair protein)